MTGLEYLKTLTDKQLEDAGIRRDWAGNVAILEHRFCPDMIDDIKKSGCAMNNLKCSDCVKAWLTKEVAYER